MNELKRYEINKLFTNVFFLFFSATAFSSASTLGFLVSVLVAIVLVVAMTVVLYRY